MAWRRQGGVYFPTRREGRDEWGTGDLLPVTIIPGSLVQIAGNLYRRKLVLPLHLPV
jgi:hypothetical protein